MDEGSKGVLGMIGLVELWQRDWFLFLWAASRRATGLSTMGL